MCAQFGADPKEKSGARGYKCCFIRGLLGLGGGMHSAAILVSALVAYCDVVFSI